MAQAAGAKTTLALHHLRTERNPVAVLEYEPRRSRNVCIVAGHGYSSSKHNLDYLCGFLASQGFRVFSLDFPGHKLGASGGELRGIDDLIDAMSATLDLALQREEPVYLLGHSMGAMTAIFTAALRPQAQGVIAITTGYGRPSALESLKNAGVTDFRSGYVDGLALPDLVAPTPAYYHRLLPALEGRPQLYVAATRDAMVHPRSVEELYGHAPQPKTLVTIESDHTNAGENSRAYVLQWLNALHPR